jgi:8-oxo-dGTP diphosphatase
LPRREFPDAPIVGVGAVVLDGNRVLLVRRGQQPLKGEWSIPGGALELGETLEAGVCREVEEETGLEVNVVAMVEILDRIVFVPKSSEGDSLCDKRGVGRVQYHYVLVDFLCSPTGGILRAGSDAMDVRWISHEELNSHGVYRLAPATAAVIEKAFRMKTAITPQKMPDAGL